MKYSFKSDEELHAFLSNNLLSAREACELLNVSTARIGHLVKSGKLKAVKQQPKMFFKPLLIEKKKELALLREKFRPYE
ncbi:helix-turn-helix domain-containing protein [Amphibacillus sediminis]|uniref:helix-turn-helix domain-containing protein n=1 Tax=Amphibacillus sediminis TaxID=360185 RepID=UPI0008321A15|nr:helix-turn-helix domain-containing protein [Amphibacillus sediminis]